MRYIININDDKRNETKRNSATGCVARWHRFSPPRTIAWLYEDWRPFRTIRCPIFHRGVSSAAATALPMSSLHGYAPWFVFGTTMIPFLSLSFSIRARIAMLKKKRNETLVHSRRDLGLSFFPSARYRRPYDRSGSRISTLEEKLEELRYKVHASCPRDYYLRQFLGGKRNAMWGLIAFTQAWTRTCQNRVFGRISTFIFNTRRPSRSYS